MRRLGPRVPEPYPLVEMAADDGRADGFRCDQVVATGPGKLGLDAYVSGIGEEKKTIIKQPTLYIIPYLSPRTRRLLDGHQPRLFRNLTRVHTTRERERRIISIRAYTVL